MFNNPVYLLILVSLLSAIGLTLSLRFLLENAVAGILVRSVRTIKQGRRLKLFASPLTLKGDVVSVGPIRTSLMEVGDGEHLPSVRTGRLIKIPNSMLINNPILVYGDTITDEVIAHLKWPLPRLDEAIGKMQEAIRENQHTPVEVGIYQMSDGLVIHGIFEVRTSSVADERTKILMTFLQKMGTDAQQGMGL